MQQLYDFKEIQERVILVGVQTEECEDVEASLDELSELAETAGAETAAKVVQNREAVHPGYYIGKGKIQEVKGFWRRWTPTGSSAMTSFRPPRSTIWSESWSARLWTGPF